MCVCVCVCRVKSISCGESVSDWLSDVIGRRCRLVRQSSDNSRRVKRKKKSQSNGGVGAECPPLSLANESQYLMVAQGSLEQLLSQIKDIDQHCELRTSQELTDRFRANLVIGGQEMEPYMEERWSSIDVGSNRFEVSKWRQLEL